MNIVDSITHSSVTRVICLYRVSTKGQVHKAEDDIPLQRIACKEYVESKQNWYVIDEFYEKGISGSKVSAENRDAIQALKERALKKDFDVLLVWKFDRLGRIPDETPFVLKWFVENGIDVWSTIEGQRKFDTSVDDLINYITFWQAGAESKNTALRIKERMQQLKAEGAYTGGYIPFGYKGVHNGRKSKKGQPLPDIVLDAYEASIIRDKIFLRYCNEGYGAYVISKMLREEGIMGRENKPFSESSVKRILRNARYKGSAVDEEVFDRVQNIMDQRHHARDEARKVNLTNRSRALLAGNIFCGDCGRRLTTRYDQSKWLTKDGIKHVEKKLMYTCYNSYRRKATSCRGQTVFYADRIDAAVDRAIRVLFDELTDKPQESILRQRFEARVATIRDRKQYLETELAKNKTKLTKLEDEIAKSLVGESLFTPDVLNRQISRLTNEIENASGEVEEIKKELADEETSMNAVLPAYTRFKSWAEEYQLLSLERKRMIACELLERVEVQRGYKIKIIFNVLYEQFCSPPNSGLKQLRTQIHGISS